jgi:pimeloyl-ACP methyl ester carboxylesterase
MGGFNALSLFLDHPEYWDAVVLLSPAIADLSPYADKEEKIEYLKRTQAYSLKQSLKHMLLGRPFNTDRIDIILANWRGLAKNDMEWKLVNPLYRLQRLSKSSTTEFFLSCGKKDPYGFKEGTKRATTLLNKIGYRTESHFIRGRHMAIPYKKVSQFLQAL